MLVTELMTKEQLREWRGKRTQKEAALAMDIPYNSYCKYESGERGMENLVERLLAKDTLKKRRTICVI